MGTSWAIASAVSISALLPLASLESAAAQNQEPQVERLDPNKTLAEIISSNAGDCHIVIRDGVPYRVCYSIPPQVNAAIKKLQAK
jgi:hypothetical protein